MDIQPKIPIGWRRLYVSEAIMDGDYYFDDSEPITTAQIAELAVQIWIDNGCISGRDSQNWQEAENQLQIERWKPHKELIGKRWYYGAMTIRQENFKAPNLTTNLNYVKSKTTKEKVAEYLEKFNKKD